VPGLVPDVARLCGQPIDGEETTDHRGTSAVKLVEALIISDGTELLDAHLAFQLNAGVDVVLAAAKEADAGVADVLDSYGQAGGVVTIRPNGPRSDTALRADLIRRAVDEHDADWVIESLTSEFWLPRGESLKDALVAIPPRYSVVQALRRPFVACSDDGGPFFERLTLRPSVHALRDGATGPMTSLLVPVLRARPGLEPAPPDRLPDGQPLRAWYPIEVLTVPAGDGWAWPPGLAGTIDGDEAEGLLSAGMLARDDRLRAVLAALRRGDGPAGRAYLSPGEREGAPPLFGVPDIVDDAAYAGECAEVGEIDLEQIERYITELERRIGWLERRLWPRVRRRLGAILRR
jgi:hypothetical protein